jgi:hypothetical protein
MKDKGEAIARAYAYQDGQPGRTGDVAISRHLRKITKRYYLDHLEIVGRNCAFGPHIATQDKQRVSD